MNRLICLFRFSIAVVLGMTSGVPVYAEGDAPTAMPPKGNPHECYLAYYQEKCENPLTAIGLGTTAGVQIEASKDPNNSQRPKDVGNGLKGSAADYRTKAEQCKTAESKCSKLCQKKEDADRCKEAFESKATDAINQANSLDNDGNKMITSGTGGSSNGDQTKPQAASGGGGGMDSGMMTGLAMAAGAGLLGYMLAKNDKKNQNENPLMNPLLNNMALQANGTVDCSKMDAYNYQDCNPYLAQLCSPEIMSGAYAGDSRCQQFGSIYCAPGPTPGAVPNTQAAISSAMMANSGTGMPMMSAPQPAVAGSGTGSPMCQNLMSYNFCMAGGHDNCPSCVQFKRATSAACVQSPALCIAQNSTAQLASARLSCPTDPMFSNPALLPGGPAVAAQLSTGAVGLPAVVLPQSVGGSSSSGAVSSSGSPDVAYGNPVGNSGGGSGASPVTSLSVASVNAGGPGGAAREGYTSGGVAASGGGSAGGVSAASGSGRGEVASGSGMAGAPSLDTGMRPSSVSRGPASDVQGQFGPSVFAMGTQVYRQRCLAGKFENCP